MDHVHNADYVQGCTSDSNPLFFYSMNIKSVKPQGPPPPTLDDQLKKASKMYEQQFLKEMMAAMRKTVVSTNEPSMAEKIYKDELNEQYVEKWADQGGNGLAEQIYKELKEKILPSQKGRYLNAAPAEAPKPKHIGQEINAGSRSPVNSENIKK